MVAVNPQFHVGVNVGVGVRVAVAVEVTVGVPVVTTVAVAVTMGVMVAVGKEVAVAVVNGVEVTTDVGVYVAVAVPTGDIANGDKEVCACATSKYVEATTSNVLIKKRSTKEYRGRKAYVHGVASLRPCSPTFERIKFAKMRAFAAQNLFTTSATNDFAFWALWIAC